MPEFSYLFVSDAGKLSIWPVIFSPLQRLLTTQEPFSWYLQYISYQTDEDPTLNEPIF